MATLSVLSFPHFRGNRLQRFPRKWGRVASGGLVAASCIPDRDKPGGRFYVKPLRLPTYKAGRSPSPAEDFTVKLVASTEWIKAVLPARRKRKRY